MRLCLCVLLLLAGWMFCSEADAQCPHGQCPWTPQYAPAAPVNAVTWQSADLFVPAAVTAVQVTATVPSVCMPAACVPAERRVVQKDRVVVREAASPVRFAFRAPRAMIRVAALPFRLVCRRCQ
jgi:hypothetical protein